MNKEQVLELYKDCGTFRRNMFIYNFCRAHSKDGQVDRGIKAYLGRKYGVSRERIRVINNRMVKLNSPKPNL